MASNLDSQSGHLRVDGQSTTVEGADRGRRGWGFLLASWLGMGLIGLWIACLVASLRQDSLVLGNSTWVPVMPVMGADFKLHLDHVARVRALGLNPYDQLGDMPCGLFPYPPMITRLFLWVVVTDPMTASAAWQVTLGLIVAVGGLAAWRTRKALGLDPIPLSMIVAAVLFSSPFLFALERGQCDPMVIPPMIVAAWLLNRRGAWPEVLSGALLGFSAWIKYCPGLAVVALLALGRKKAMAAFVLVVAVVGIVDLDNIRKSIRNGKIIEAIMVAKPRGLHVVSHSLSEAWQLNPTVRASSLLQKVPPVLPAAILTLIPIVLVSRAVARSGRSRELTLPYFLWLASVATYGLPYSNDYNLVALPIVLFMVWDRRDHRATQLALMASCLWLQPFWLPIAGSVLVYVKLAALYAVGACLAARASAAVANDAVPGFFRPAFARVDRPSPTTDASHS